MGERGPMPKPSAVLRLNGSDRAAKRERDEKVRPSVEMGEPERPGWLTEDAVEHWDAVLAHLRPVPGLLAKIDGMALALFAQSLADYIAARAIVKSEGLTISGSQGGTILNPASRAAKSAWEQIMKASAQFGLSPADRARLATPTEGGKEPGNDKGYFAAG